MAVPGSGLSRNLFRDILPAIDLSGGRRLTSSSATTAGRRLHGPVLVLRIGGALSVVAFVLAWQVVSASGLISTVLLPSPVAVVEALVRVSVNGYRGTSLLGDALATSGRCLAGFVAAMIVGVPFGLAMGAAIGSPRPATTSSSSCGRCRRCRT